MENAATENLWARLVDCTGVCIFLCLIKKQEIGISCFSTFLVILEEWDTNSLFGCPIFLRFFCDFFAIFSRFFCDFFAIFLSRHNSSFELSDFRFFRFHKKTQLFGQTVITQKIANWRKLCFRTSTKNAQMWFSNLKIQRVPDSSRRWRDHIWFVLELLHIPSAWKLPPEMPLSASKIHLKRDK